MPESINGKKYTLRYLPVFLSELNAAAMYIAGNLSNESAAENLVSNVEKAIKKRLYAPEAFQPCDFKGKHKDKYYSINVGNYTILYVVIGEVMEVRRFVYASRNMEGILN